MFWSWKLLTPEKHQANPGMVLWDQQKLFELNWILL